MRLGPDCSKTPTKVKTRPFETPNVPFSPFRHSQSRLLTGFVQVLKRMVPDKNVQAMTEVDRKRRVRRF